MPPDCLPLLSLRRQLANLYAIVSESIFTLPFQALTNRPAKGSTITVEPIKSTSDIKKIKKILANNPRDLCLFTLGINTNLRASDLLNIKIEQVQGLKTGDELALKEIKTGKSRRITLNKNAVKAIGGLLASSYKQGDYTCSWASVG